MYKLVYKIFKMYIVLNLERNILTKELKLVTYIQNEELIKITQF